MRFIKKMKEGGVGFFSLLVVPVLVVLISITVALLGEQNIIKKRTQTAVDATLLYLSTSGMLLQDPDGKIFACLMKKNYIDYMRLPKGLL